LPGDEADRQIDITGTGSLPDATSDQGLSEQGLSEQALSLDMLMGALRADSTDIGIYARVLTESLGEALPPDCVTVERDRSVSDRMRGRPGTVAKVTVRLGDQVMSLGVVRGAPAAEICREVRGVVLSRQPVPVSQWISALAAALMQHAQDNAATAAALRRLVAGG
jgi:hypothetical protein